MIHNFRSINIICSDEKHSRHRHRCSLTGQELPATPLYSRVHWDIPPASATPENEIRFSTDLQYVHPGPTQITSHPSIPSSQALSCQYLSGTTVHSWQTSKVTLHAYLQCKPPPTKVLLDVSSSSAANPRPSTPLRPQMTSRILLHFLHPF